MMEQLLVPGDVCMMEQPGEVCMMEQLLVPGDVCMMEQLLVMSV